MKNTAATKKEAIIKVLKEGKSVTEVAREYQISRKTVYSWIKLYNSAHGKGKHLALKNKYRKAETHPKAKLFRTRHRLIQLIITHPEWGVRQYSREVGVNYNSIYKLLVTLGASTPNLRHNFKRNYQGPGRLASDVRLEIVRKAQDFKASVTTLSKQYGVARKTIYKWIKSYQIDPKLTDSYAKAEAHPKALYPKLTARVLEIVAESPHLSVHKIAELVPASSWTVWSILDRKGLNTASARAFYADREAAEKITPITASTRTDTVFESFTPNTAPAPPPNRLLNFFKYFAASFTTTSILSIGIVFWYKLLFAASTGPAQTIGYLFATLSLVMGSIFLLYSLKYYLTLAIVLSYSQDNPEKKSAYKKRSLLNLILGGKDEEENYSPNNSSVGLEADLSYIKFDRKPYISVHIPFYNEKNVVERAIRAATSFKYGGEYEVILCDDSTDETTQIIRQYQKDCLFKGEALKEIKGDGWSLTEVEVKPGVTLKHLHRTTRSGYKGKALELALSLVNPKTEFVGVFDADFVPYPDSLDLFLRYFKAANNMSENYTASNVAAVQGYQWHVLNKSENWITRGVRSEYSGSYVIERSGAEIYGGLKQISGSVYMIRRDVLEKIGWGTSITEDFELTLRLYNAGLKVVYTPYIQAPAECVSTVKRLVRQRMRWAEGHSFNVKKMFKSLMLNPALSVAEKAEFAYLSPYYLQAFFFLIGTAGWVISETIFRTTLPFWTEIWGWSLVLTNIIALPLVNAVGLFMEESEDKDYTGILSFIALSYLLVPFQAYAAVKGLIEKEEGPWFRTPKTGRITDLFSRGRFYRWLVDVVKNMPQPSSSPIRNFVTNSRTEHQSSKPIVGNRFFIFDSRLFNPRSKRFIGNAAVSLALVVAMLVNTGARYVQVAEAAGPTLKTPGKPLSTNTNDQKTLNPVARQTENNIDFAKRLGDSSEETSNSQIFSFETPAGQVDEVFYKDPMFRVKNNSHQIQFSLISMSGVNKNSNAKMYSRGNSVLYKDVFKSADVRLTANSGYVTESIIVKEKTKIQSFEYLVKGVGVEPRETAGSIEFVDEKTQQTVFTLAPAYMYEASMDSEKGSQLGLTEIMNSDIKYSLGISYKLRTSPMGWILTKELTAEGKNWIEDPNRKFPIVIDPSVIVAGSMVDAETNYGSLQRKIAYVNGNWYAFHNDGGSVLYKKSADGSTWGSNVDIESSDTDNYNPSIWVKENVIWVSWVDDNSNTVQFRSIDTANSDSLGTLTTCQDLGAGVDNSYFPSIAVQSTGSDIFMAFTDADTGGSMDAWRVQSVGTCTVSQSILSGSGLTIGDKPVLSAAENDIYMIFQDGDLSYSHWSASGNAWAVSNTTIESVTDSAYSVVSDGSDVWVLSQSGTTSTNFYQIGGITETTVASDLAANRLFTDIHCPASGDCKIVYSDPAVSISYFVDCDSTSCSAPTITSLNTEATGDARRGAPVSIDCSAGATDCKVILTARDLTSYARLRFYDCDNAACSTTGTVQQLIGLGDDIPSYVDINCLSSTDCKFIYAKSSDNTLHFVDCDDTNCTATRTDTAIDTNVGDFGGSASVYCPATDDCKVSYYDSNTNGSVIFLDCAAGNDNCSGAPTTTTIDSNVGIVDTVYNKISCAAGATECRVIYYDGTDDAVYYYDCNASATCASGSATTIDSAAGAQGSPLDLFCNNNAGSPDDCKIIYYDGIDMDISFVDCNNDTCSAPAINVIESNAGADSAFLGLHCGLGVSDCQIVYLDGSEQDLSYINCNDADCDTPDAFSDVDTNIAGSNTIVSMDCPTGDNCKIVYNDVSAQKLIFADCNDVNCTAPSFIDINSAVGRQGIDSSIDCLTADDCKIVYWDFYASTLRFVDCGDESCSSQVSSAIDATSRRFAPNAVVCLTATDCKIVYYDEADADITFLDCANASCSSVDATTDIDTSANGAAISMDCVAADNCKVVYSDAGTLVFLDCGTTGCGSTSTSNVDTSIGVLPSIFSVDCVGGDTDCKVFWYDQFEGDVTFRDCDAANCSTGTTTDVDADGTALTANNIARMDCPAADNCKLIYSDALSNSINFVDCENATCASKIIVAVSTVATRNTGRGYINCPTSGDCKLVFSNTQNQSMDFVDCLNEKCIISTLTSPWTSETNVLGVSISYDSANSDLYAHIIKDATEQVYFKSTDAATISWSSETSYGFTAGDINNISSSYSGSGTSEIGVTLRQGTNYEFAPVPEGWWVLSLSTLVALFIIKRKQKNYN
jgi:cellulose synthase/poly-beta-1,6-N-acetylglucosamine synthase-like glycosyltransferase/transposase-like protein